MTDKLPGEHTGHDVTKSFRCPESVVVEAEEWSRRNGDVYENFSHYVRVALIRLNRANRRDAGVDGVEEALRK